MSAMPHTPELAQIQQATLAAAAHVLVGVDAALVTQVQLATAAAETPSKAATAAAAAARA